MKYLGTFKTTQTMYFDYDCCYWDMDKPEGTYKKDYTLMKVGTRLKAYALPQIETVDFEDYKITLKNKNSIVYFKNIDDLRSCRWIEEVKKNE